MRYLLLFLLLAFQSIVYGYSTNSQQKTDVQKTLISVKSDLNARNYDTFRYYDPSAGIYVSQDPIGLHGGMPNMYSYVHDLNAWTDPFGLNKKCTPKSAQKKIKKGQGPSEIGRIDAPEQSVPGSQWHAHGKGKYKGALNQDGSIHDSNPKFSNKTKKWLNDHGWSI